MKTAVDSYGGVKGCHAAVVKIQESNQTMKKHTLTGIRALNNFTFESVGLRAWRAYNVGPGKLFTPTQVKRFGLPQGPTVSKSCSPLAYHERMDGGVFRFLDLCQQGLSACILNLAFHNLLKISQLMKLHDLSYPVLRKDVQRHASLLQICRNTWMWVKILSN